MVDGFSCILDFPKFYGGEPPDPPYKGNSSIKPSTFFFNNNSSQRQKKKKKKKKEPESLPLLKQSTRNLTFGYTEIQKRRRALGQDLFCVICNWAVWIAEDKSLGYLHCQFLGIAYFFTLSVMTKFKFLCCLITLNCESSRDLLLSVTNRKALAQPHRAAPLPPPPPPL